MVALNFELHDRKPLSIASMKIVTTVFFSPCGHCYLSMYYIHTIGKQLQKILYTFTVNRQCADILP